MRRLLVAGFAALAVLLGLIATTGTAFAQGTPPSWTKCPTGQHHGPGGVCVADGAGQGNGGSHNWPGNGGPRGHGYPGTWNDRLDGRYFRLDQGPALDVCDSGASNYDVWLNRNGSYRDRIVRQLNAQRWNDLRRVDCGAVSVSNDGQCVTFRQDALRYGNDLNTNRRDWSGLRLRLLSSHRGWNGSDLNVLSLSERNDWNRYVGLDRDRYNNYNRVYSQLKTVCNDPNPQVVIVQAPAPVTYAAPAAAAPSGNDAAAAPAPASTTGSIPSGHYEGGGNSVAFTLAHARAI